jgi:hypothetical protein
MAGRKPRGSTPEDVFALTGLTRDELSALAEELKEVHFDPFPMFLEGHGMTLEALKKYLIENHFHFYVPAHLFEKLKQLIETLQRPWTRAEIKRERWHTVRRCLDLGARYEAYKVASLVLKGTPAEASPHMMKKDYDDLQRTLPQEERRPRTYSKRWRWRPSDALKAALRLAPPAGTASNATISEEQVAALEALIVEVGGEKAGMLQKNLAIYLKVQALSDLPVSRFSDAIRMLEAKRERQERELAAAKTAK